ncbi:MAG: hypothetical protein J6J24_04890 [Clostridia bacterium]|nr:hypothetical protein [Clostridia bacterium]
MITHEKQRKIRSFGKKERRMTTKEPPHKQSKFLTNYNILLYYATNTTPYNV